MKPYEKENKKDGRKERRSINKSEALESFIALHPAFYECWSQAQEDYGEAAPRHVYGYIAGALIKNVSKQPNADLDLILEYVEKLMRDGEDDVRGIISVYFIEDLLTIGSHYPKETAPILRKLGPLSRDFALEYDRIVGGTNEVLEK